MKEVHCRKIRDYNDSVVQRQPRSVCGEAGKAAAYRGRQGRRIPGTTTLIVTDDPDGSNIMLASCGNGSGNQSI